MQTTTAHFPDYIVVHGVLLMVCSVFPYNLQTPDLTTSLKNSNMICIIKPFQNSVLNQLEAGLASTTNILKFNVCLTYIKKHKRTKNSKTHQFKAKQHIALYFSYFIYISIEHEETISHTNIWTFRQAAEVHYSHTNIWTFRQATVVHYSHTNIWTFRQATVVHYSHTNIWTFRQAAVVHYTLDLLVLTSTFQMQLQRPDLVSRNELILEHFTNNFSKAIRINIADWRFYYISSFLLPLSFKFV